jgi:putative hydrolase of the HAD superfamily
VVRHLGLHRHFAEHVPIEAMRVHGQLRPKPSRLMLRRLLRRQRLDAARCVLVEDTLDNLKSAHSLGLRTVWFTGFSPKVFFRPAFADVQVKSLHQLPKRLARLRG